MNFEQMCVEDRLDYVDGLNYNDFEIVKNEEFGHRIFVNEDTFNWLVLFGSLKYGDPQYTVGSIMTHTSRFECCGCGKYFEAITHLDFSNKTIRLEHTTQPKKSGCNGKIDQMVFNLKIKCPSGKLVFGNDLRYINRFKNVNKKAREIDIHYKAECIRSMELYARWGLMYLQCGNSCPKVYKMPDGSIMVGRDHIYDYENDDDIPNPEYEGAEYIDGVCTDLWAVHAIDHDLYMKHHSEDLDDGLRAGHFIVDVSHLGEELNIEYHYNFDRGSNVLGRITGNK